jgi:hypothetical protein
MSESEIMVCSDKSTIQFCLVEGKIQFFISNTLSKLDLSGEFDFSVLKMDSQLRIIIVIIQIFILF